MAKRQMVPVDEIPPPFKHGDWITVVGPRSVQFAPKGVARVWQAVGAPEYVGPKQCGCGWRYRDVGADHFRKATLHDFKAEMKRLDELVEKWISRRNEFEEKIRELTVEDR
jgi:hypothetical protein